MATLTWRTFLYMMSVYRSCVRCEIWHLRAEFQFHLRQLCWLPQKGSCKFFSHQEGPYALVLVSSQVEEQVCIQHQLDVKLAIPIRKKPSRETTAVIRNMLDLWTS